MLIVFPRTLRFSNWNTNKKRGRLIFLSFTGWSVLQNILIKIMDSLQFVKEKMLNAAKSLFFDKKPSLSLYSSPRLLPLLAQIGRFRQPPSHIWRSEQYTILFREWRILSEPALPAFRVQKKIIGSRFFTPGQIISRR